MAVIVRLFPDALASLLAYLLGYSLQDETCWYPCLLAPQFDGCALLLRGIVPQLKVMSRARVESCTYW
jgi:hypothetical protein